METIPKLFAMLQNADVEIKEGEHQVLMVNKTTSFKRARERKGSSRRMTKQLLLPRRNPKVKPKPETKCSHCKGKYHQERNFLKVTGK